jgi:murein DD-endopeptidase MepM/ murein hydrolase activator NlpD
VDTVPGKVGIPDRVKSVCEQYNKIKGGCFDQKETSPSDGNTLQCIGKAMDDASDSVELYGIKGTVKVKKDVIKEIIKAGKEASADEQTIRIAISLHPAVSLQNAWKETGSTNCYGIAQLCDRPNSTGYREVREALKIPSPEVFLESPKLQMLAIKTLRDIKLKQLETAPSCFADKFKGKSAQYKILYVWNEVSCDGDSSIEAVTKSQFADVADKNFSATECNEFKTKLAFNYTSNVAYQDRPYNYAKGNDIEVDPFYAKKLYASGLTVQTYAQYKIIDNAQCVELKKYKPFMEAAANRYANPTMPLSSQIIGAMMSRETNVGILTRPQGCAGYADGGRGHGLGQADPSSDDGLTGLNSPVGLKLTKNYRKAENIARLGTKTETFIWSDCKDGVMYIGAHLLTKQEAADGTIRGKLTGAGLPLDTDEKGAFKDKRTKKAYFQLLLDSYNAGEGGIQRASCSVDSNGTVRDWCTSPSERSDPRGKGDYGVDVLNTAVEVAKCIGGGATIEEILDFIGTGAGIGTVECATNALASTNAGDAEFPLVTKPGLQVRWTQPWPNYLIGNGGGKHNGIDLGIEPVDPEQTKIVAIADGDIIQDGIVNSNSCSGGTCNTKNQRYIRLKIADGREFGYVHLDTRPEKKFFTIGAKVKKGDVLGQIDNFMFVHLHFSVYVNGIDVQPTDHIKGWPSTIQVSAEISTQVNRLPTTLTQKL